MSTGPAALAERLPPQLRIASWLLRQMPAQLPGKLRLARTILRGTGACLVRDRYGHQIAVPSAEEPIAQHLFASGIYEPELSDFLRGYLRTGDCFVDVGANVGVHTVCAADWVGPTGTVIAVEASPRVIPFLRANIESNRAGNVIVSDRACAAPGENEVDVYLPPDRMFGMASRAPRFEVVPTQVGACTLDALLKEHGRDRVRIIKVDIEGAELAAFRGAHGLLTGPEPPLIVFEFTDWSETGLPGIEPGSAQRYLQGVGYELWTLESFVAGSAPLSAPLVTGDATLVARRRS